MPNIFRAENFPFYQKQNFKRERQENIIRWFSVEKFQGKQKKLKFLSKFSVNIEKIYENCKQRFSSSLDSACGIGNISRSGHRTPSESDVAGECM